MPRKCKTATPTVQPFTNADWDGMAGAEGWGACGAPNGWGINGNPAVQPLRGFNGAVDLVISLNNMQAFVVTKAGFCTYYTANTPIPTQAVGIVLGNAVLAATMAATPSTLTAILRVWLYV